MKAGKVVLVVAVVFLYAGGAVMGRPAGGVDHRATAEKFFQYVAEGKPQEGVDFVFASNPWMARQPDELQKMKNQLHNLTGLVGEYHGHDIVVEDDIAGRFVHVSYLAFYDRQPVRFSFQFYKPKDTWMTYNFKFDTDFDDEMAAAAKLDLLKAMRQR